MLIVDAHLDLSMNALCGRDVLRPAREQTADEGGIPTVGLPDLPAGNVKLICATVFCMPSIDGKPGYRTGAEARAEGLRHLDWYRQQIEAGRIQFITTAAQLNEVANPTPLAPHDPQPAILLLEGADPLLDEQDVANWHAAGLRIVGLSWRQTRLAGGTGAPGPLTDEGRRLVRQLDRFHIIHDASHLAEQAFWQLLDASAGPVIASHSNCRSIVPTDRQLSDEMIRAIARRGGVIGINFFDKFLLPPDQVGKRRATLADVVDHIRHICQLLGNARHVAIGTDMDGGLGRNEIPVDVETSADLPKLADALSAAGFGQADIAAIMGENWLSFFRRTLPAAAQEVPA